MAILVTLDVDDNGTVKIENAVDALARLGATYTREGKKIADAGDQVAKSQKGQADALSALVQNAGAVQGATLKQAQAFSVLSRELKAGGTVTTLHANALSSLSTQLQGSTALTGRQQSALASLASTMQAGNAVTAQQAAAVKGLSQAFAQNTAEANNGGSALDTYRTKAVALATAFTLLAGGSYALLRSAGDLAARVEVLGTVQRIVAENAYQSSAQMQIETEKIKHLGITTKEATEATIQFAQAELKMADAAKVARVAQDLAVVAGKNSSEAFSSLTTAIQIQQPMLLRQFGIVTGLDTIYGEYARSVGKTVKELDGFDKKQAFINKILQEGEKVAGAYEASMLDVGKQMTSMKRYTEEAELVLGKALLPTMMLVVRGTSDFLKAWANAPATFQAATTALLAFVAILGTLGALLAAGKWITTLGIFKELIAWWQAARVAAAGLAAGTALAEGAAVGFFATVRAGIASLSGVTLALGGIVIALAALAAAYVYLSSKRAAETEDLKRETLAAIAVQQDKEALVEWFRNEANVVYETHSQWERYAKKKEELQKLAPQFIEVMGQETEKLKLNEAAIRANADAWENQRQVRKKDLQDRIAELKAEITQQEALLRYETKELGTDKDSWYTRNSPIMRGVGALRARMWDQGELDSMKRSLKEMEELSKALFPEDEIRENAQAAKQHVRDAMTSFGDSFAEAAAKIKKAGAGDMFKQWETGLKQVSFFGPDGKKQFKDAQMTADDYMELLRGITDKVQKYDAELEKRSKGIQQAVKGIFEQSEKNTVQMMAQKQAFDTLFKESYAKGDVEETTRLMKLFGGQIEKLGSPTELAAQGFKDLARASQQWKDQKLEDYARGLTREMEQAVTAITDAAQNMAEGLWSGIQKQVDDASERMIESERAVMDKVLDMDRDLFEKQVVSRMNATDQAIYQETKRVAEIERAIEREIEARDRGFQRMRSEADAKAELARKEMDDLIRKATLQRDLKQAELEAELAVARVRQDPEAVRLLEGQLEVYKKVTAEFKTRVEVVRQTASQEIEVWRQNQHEMIDIEQAKSDQLAGMQRGAVDRQKAYSASAIREIIRDNNAVYQSLRNVSDMVLNGFIDGFGKVITGAQSFKDVLVGIWTSLKQTLLGAIAEMATGWLKLLTMPGPGHASGAGGVGGGGGAWNMIPGAAGAGGMFGIMPMLMSVPGAGGGAQQTPGGGAGGWGMAFQNWKSMGSNLKNLWGKGTSAWGAKPGWFGGAGAGSSSGMLGYAAGGAVGAMAGYGVGNWVGSSTGSKGWGALSGAATGAGTGFLMGGPIGAAIGGIAGLIGGILGAGKAQKQIQSAREEFIKMNGGLAELQKQAAAGGMSLDKMLSTKNPKEFQAELAKIDNGLKSHTLITDFEQANGGAEELKKRAAEAGVSLDEMYTSGMKAEDYAKAIEKVAKALELQKAKDGLAKTASQMDDLRKKAVLVGYDLSTLYDATSIEAFNGQQQILNDLLEKQQLRLDGLGRAAEGIKQRTAGLVAAVGKGLESVFGTDEGGAKNAQSFFDTFAEARAKGYAGTAADFAKDQKLPNLDKMLGVIKTAEQGFTSLGASATATFAAILRETGDINAAMAAIGEPLDQLIALQERLGLKADVGLQKLMDLRKTITVNQDVADSLSGIANIVKGLGDAGMLTADTFSAMGADAASMWDTLMSRGVSADQALLMMQPTLQALYEAQQNFGFATDESTQKLIDMGIEHGLVGDQFQSINQKMLDMLVIIAEVLGADIPEAYRKQAQAAQEATNQQREGLGLVIEGTEEARKKLEQYRNDWNYKGGNIEGNIGDVQDGVFGVEDAGGGVIAKLAESEDAFKRWRDTAVSAAQDVSYAVDAVSMGHSPGGLKEIPLKLDEARSAFRISRNAMVADTFEMERAANRYADTLDVAGRIQASGVKPYASDAGLDAAVSAPGTSQSAGPSDAGSPMVVQVTAPVSAPQFTIQALDGADVERVMADKIIPQLVAMARTNDGQFTRLLEEALTRYRR